jgi:C-terminal processing protease CtpA/Prc
VVTRHDNIFGPIAVADAVFVQPLLKKTYRNPVVVLINEEAQSYAEGICMYMQATGRVKFVGSPTAGTSGGGATVFLPGGWWLSFTGERVLHGDRTQLQNRGILPAVLAEPTIDGVRQGRDEVLEKGFEVLEQLIGRRTDK